jgi:hypothetical protein
MSFFFKNKTAGQSAMELATFGSIVIFVIAMILRVTLRTSQSVNVDLRAFRMALLESSRTGRGEYTLARYSGARSNASIILIEDRLAIDASQAVTRDRMPFMAQATATMTQSMLLDINPENKDDIPVMDIFINGQRFPLAIAQYVRKDLAALRNSTSALEGIVPCNAQDFGPGRGACYFTDTLPTGKTVYRYIFYRKIHNGGNREWCSSAGCVPTADRRFDLDFDGTPDIPSSARVPWGGSDMALRSVFTWQWFPVKEWLPVAEGGLDPDGGQFVDITGSLAEEGVHKLERDIEEGYYFFEGELVDPVPGELLAVWVMDYAAGDIDMTADAGAEARWKEYRSKTSPDPGPFRTPGLQLDMTIYSETRYGILENRDNKLYDSEGRFVRNAARQDQLDIIERKLYISKDTGRFCSLGGGGTPCGAAGGCAPTRWGNSEYAGLNGLLGMTNPVEACLNQPPPPPPPPGEEPKWPPTCMSGAYRRRTCMMVRDKPAPTIYVRSRIRDRRESVWTTR